VNGKMKALFDYQRFSDNVRLNAIIVDVEKRYATALSDEDLSLVSAAGEAFQLLEDADDDM